MTGKPARAIETAVLLALTMGAAACSKSGSATHGATAANATAMPEANNPASANDGATIYIDNCSSCHQSDGRGVDGAFPPLDGAAIVTGDPAKVIRIVKFGARGPMRVHGTEYDGAMPSWENRISDTDIAAVVSYIRTSWSNKANAVSLAQVRAVPPPTSP